MSKDPAAKPEDTSAPPRAPRALESGTPLTYTRKVVIAVGVAAATAALVMFLYSTADILVLCFAGLLFAVFLSAPADLLSARVRIKRVYALAIVGACFAAIVLGGGYFMGYTITRQTQQLATTLPGALAQFGSDLQRRFMPPPAAESAQTETSGTASGPAEPAPAATVGAASAVVAETGPSASVQPGDSDNWLAEELNRLRHGATEFFFSESFVRRAGGVAGGVVSSTFGVLGNIAVVLGVGLFFALNPRLYSQGLVKLIPPAHRPRATDILAQLGTQLEWWFVGQLCSMASIAVLTYIGLTILGIPMAVTLAILAGLMNFIPNFGPLIAAAPAVLIAFAPTGDQTMLNPARAGWVILVYVIIQLLEGWVITPYFQKRAVELPPALIIVAQVVFALLLGPIGLILATPILVATLVLVRMVYIEEVLGDRPGKQGGAAARPHGDV
jgi:predicted PurR-regulated permease PerM